SSNSSRTAAQTTAWASPTGNASRVAQSSGCGPAQPMNASESDGSTLPPGNAYMFGANAIVEARRIAYTSYPGDVGRSRMTVAASRGTAGSAPASAKRAALSASHIGASTRIPLGSSVNVNHHRGALSDPDAGGRDAVSAAATAQLTADVDHNARG